MDSTSPQTPTATSTSASSNKPDPHVLIIGAGLTGLLIAQGLKKSGIPFSIYESEEASTFRRKEWTMGIHWGVPLMESLLPDGTSSRLISEACVDRTLDYITPPTNGSRIYDGVTGDVLKELVSEGKLLRVSRRKLRKLIGEGIDVHFGHKLRDITYVSPDAIASGRANLKHVLAHFDNGAAAAGTILVGADGPRSQVRSHIFHHDASAAVRPLQGIVFLAATFKYPSAEQALHVRSAHPVFSMMLHPDIFAYLCIQDAPDPDTPAGWTFFLNVSWLGERDTSLSLEEVKHLAQDKASNLQEPFRSAILWIPEDVVLEPFDVGYWISQEWSTLEGGGKLTLAGDAAHPMPPFRGQGMNHAIQDAYNFVDMMRKVSQGEGEQEGLVKEYSDEVAMRGAEETEVTIRNAYMLLGYEDFKESPYMKRGLGRG